MPPRRTRGIRKGYAEIPEGDDHEIGPVSVPDNESDDADFSIQAAQRAQNQGGDGDSGEDEDEDDNDDAYPSSVDQAISGAATPKRIRNVGAGMTQSRKNYHEIPNYPLETRIVTRVYAGPLRRYARYSALRDAMYGPELHSIRIIWDMEKRWTSFSVFPPGYPPSHPQGVVPTPWVAPNFDSDQEVRARRWYSEYQTNEPNNQRIRGIPIKHGESLVPQADGDIILLSGPVDEQKQYQLRPGTGIPLSSSGLGIQDTEIRDKHTMARGWVLDVGGIPVATEWAPSTRQDVQLLAVATIPFSDQAKPQPDAKGDGEKETTTGTIQFWEFTPDPDSPGLAIPSSDKPAHVLTRCFDWGRPRRIRWCPCPMESNDRYGMLAILSGDGIVRVIDVKRVTGKSSTPTYEWMETPLTELGITNHSDHNIKVTCLAWANLNRIVLGHTDGSTTLWSVYPRQLLQRVGIHTSHIIDISTGYPSNPYILATIPVGGCATITDLSQPNSETTYFPVPAITFQPNVLAWSEPMQGFLMLYPSSTPNTTVAFLHHRFFPQARSICTGTNTVTCIAAGATHPILLMGAADGTVYTCNALQKLFKQKSEPLNKIKLLEHEFRPVEAWNTKDNAGPSVRGAARILQGFLPEVNDDPRTEKRKGLDRKRKIERAKKAVGRKKGATAAGCSLTELDDRLASRMVLHEPLTRVTYLAWNPNLMFSCWAACSMGSGLVRVIDVGVRE